MTPKNAAHRRRMTPRHVAQRHVAEKDQPALFVACGNIVEQ